MKVNKLIIGMCFTSCIMISCNQKDNQPREKVSDLLWYGAKVIAKEFRSDTRGTNINPGISTSGNLVFSFDADGSPEAWNMYIVFDKGHELMLDSKDWYEVVNENDKVVICVKAHYDLKGDLRDVEVVDLQKKNEFENQSILLRHYVSSILGYEIDFGGEKSKVVDYDYGIFEIELENGASLGKHKVDQYFANLLLNADHFIFSSIEGYFKVKKYRLDNKEKLFKCELLNGSEKLIQHGGIKSISAVMNNGNEVTLPDYYYTVKGKYY